MAVIKKFVLTDEQREQTHPDIWIPDEPSSQSLTMKGIRIQQKVYFSVKAIIKSLKGIKQTTNHKQKQIPRNEAIKITNKSIVQDGEANALETVNKNISVMMSDLIENQKKNVHEYHLLPMDDDVSEITQTTTNLRNSTNYSSLHSLLDEEFMKQQMKHKRMVTETKDDIKTDAKNYNEIQPNCTIPFVTF